jgi:hypothetical protein
MRDPSRWGESFRASLIVRYYLNGRAGTKFITLIYTGAQANTQQYGKRPYGVGFLVIGKDVRQGVSCVVSFKRIDFFARRKLDLTCSSFRRRASPMNTTRIPSELEAKAQRRTWRITTPNTKTVSASNRGGVRPHD